MSGQRPIAALVHIFHEELVAEIRRYLEHIPARVARTAALRPLVDLNLTEDDFEIEQGQVDGTLAHVIEHLFYYCCECAGFTWARISRPEFLLNPSSALDVSDPTYVDRFFPDTI